MRVIQFFKSIHRLGLIISISNFKLRNEGTWLGVFWYLLNPILMFLLLLGIFSPRLGNTIPNYALYLLIGILMFNFFQKCSMSAVTVIKENQGIVKSIKFPHESLVLSIIFLFLFSHFFEVLVVIAFLIFFKVSIKLIVFYPLILLFLLIFLYGFCLILASIGVYFYDLDNIWIFVSTLIWFATPIFYEIGGQTKLQVLNYFNPLYYYITLARDIIVYTRIPETWMILVAIAMSVFFFGVGLLIFNRLKRRFSELL